MYKNVRSLSFAFPNSYLTRNQLDEEPLCYLQIIIYLVIYLFIEAILLFDVSVGVAVITHCLM